jgi:hypothetical protein
MEWTESSCLLKSGYPMGHPWVGKNTRVGARFVSGQIRVAPVSEKLCLCLYQSGQISTGYPIPIPELSFLLSGGYFT